MPLNLTFEAVLKPKNAAQSLFGWIIDPASDPTKGIKDFSVSLKTMKDARSAVKKAGFSIVTFSINGNYIVCYGLTRAFEDLFGVVIYDYKDTISTSKDDLQDMIDIRNKQINSKDQELIDLIKNNIDGILLRRPQRILEDPIRVINQNDPPPISIQHDPNSFVTRSSDEPVPLELIEKLGGNKDILIKMGLGEGVNIGVIDTGWLGSEHPYNNTIKGYFDIKDDLNVQLKKFPKEQIVFEEHIRNFNAQFLDNQTKFNAGDYASVQSFLSKFFPWEETKYIELLSIDIKKQENELEEQRLNRVKNALQPYYDEAKGLIDAQRAEIENFMYSRDDESPYHGTKVVFQILPFAPKARINVYKSFETLNDPTSIDYLIGGAFAVGNDELISNSWGPFYEKKIDKGGGDIQNEVLIQGNTPDEVRKMHIKKYEKYISSIEKNKNKRFVFHAAANGRLKTIFQESPGNIISVGGAFRKTVELNKVFASTGSSGYAYSPSFFSWSKETTPSVCGWYEKLWVPCVKYESTGLGEEKKTIVQWTLTEGNSLACPQVVGITASVLSYLKNNKVPYSFDVIQEIIRNSVDLVTDGNFAQAEPERAAEKNTGIINIFKVYSACNKLIAKNKEAVKGTGSSNSFFW